MRWLWVLPLALGWVACENTADFRHVDIHDTADMESDDAFNDHEAWDDADLSGDVDDTDEATVDTLDQTPLDTEPDTETPAECLTHCAFLRSCGAIPDTTSCDDLCAELASTPLFSSACRTCMAQTCSQAATCLLTDSGCGVPGTDVMLSISALPPQAEVQVAVTLWDGQTTGASGAVAAGDAGVAILNLGAVLIPGITYNLVYFVDVNGDGICEAESDLAGQKSVFVDQASALVYAMHTHAQSDPTLCTHFRSRTDLCQARCALAANCSADEAGPDCVSRCEGEPVAVTLQCLHCLGDDDCATQSLRCRQPGGACEIGYVPPNATLIIGTGSGGMFTAHAGAPVPAQVHNSGARVVAEGQSTVRDDGGFLLNFGEVVWRNQSYTTFFFFDDNHNAACDPNEVVYALDVDVGEVAMIYQLFTADMLRDATCTDLVVD